MNYFRPEDFLHWCATDRLIQELIGLIFQICHVVLGLKPSSKQDEIAIVKSVPCTGRVSLSWFNDILFSRHFLRREQYPFTEAQSGVSSKTYHWINCNRFTSKPGSSWYLIVMDWWLRWESSTVTPTEYTPGTINKKNSSSKLNKLTNGNDNK